MSVLPRLRRREDPVGEILVQADDLQHRVRRLGRRISKDYRGQPLLLVGVLKDAVFFVADLMRAIETDCELDFMAIESQGSERDASGLVRILKDLDASVTGRHVIVVTELVSSGLTMSFLVRTLEARNPLSLEVCALLVKPSRREIELEIKYVGFEIPDRFVMGYGLDHEGSCRQLPYVAAVTPEEPETKPPKGGRER